MNARRISREAKELFQIHAEAETLRPARFRKLDENRPALPSWPRPIQLFISFNLSLSVQVEHPSYKNYIYTRMRTRSGVSLLSKAM